MGRVHWVKKLPMQTKGSFSIVQLTGPICFWVLLYNSKATSVNAALEYTPSLACQHSTTLSKLNLDLW